MLFVDSIEYLCYVIEKIEKSYMLLSCDLMKEICYPATPNEPYPQGIKNTHQIVYFKIIYSEGH